MIERWREKERVIERWRETNSTWEMSATAAASGTRNVYAVLDLVYSGKQTNTQVQQQLSLT